MDMRKAMTIAGSDSGGGAGIQADLKTFAAFGVYGTTALTAVTAQNTLGVQGVSSIPPELVALQIDSIMTDIGADAVKTGMLADSEIIEAVADRIRFYDIRKLVVDPVMVAKGGEHLLARSAVDILRQKLIPLAAVVTPNLAEAEVLTGRPVTTMDGMRNAAAQIMDMGARSVVIKGGHLEGDAADLFIDGSGEMILSQRRIDSSNTHGTGCTFSAAITAGLANGLTIAEAVKEAKSFISDAIRFAVPLGVGHGPTHHMARLYRCQDRWLALEDIKQALISLKAMQIGHLIPETQTNLAVSIPNAFDVMDVAAIPGRIIRIGKTVDTLTEPAFGASHSMASMVLTAQKLDPSIRSAMNIRFTENVLEACKKAGYSMVEFSWPKPGEQMEIGRLGQLIAGHMEAYGRSPDIVFNRGGWGKEAHIEFFARSGMEMVQKIERVLSALEQD
jgi:hydroxymethylpyrimidine/phosphomethylpyrimidine kinase